MAQNRRACLAAELPLPLDGRLGLEDLAELLGDGEANLQIVVHTAIIRKVIIQNPDNKLRGVTIADKNCTPSNLPAEVHGKSQVAESVLVVLLHVRVRVHDALGLQVLPDAQLVAEAPRHAPVERRHGQNHGAVLAAVQK